MTDEERQIIGEMREALMQHEQASHLARVHQSAADKARREAEEAEEKFKDARARLRDLFSRMRMGKL